MGNVAAAPHRAVQRAQELEASSRLAADLLCTRLGRASEGEPLYKDMIERRTRLQGADQRQTLVSINNYAVALGQLDRQGDAEPLFREIVATAKTNSGLGPNDRDTKAFAENYAKCLEALGRGDEARDLRKLYGLEAPK